MKLEVERGGEGRRRGVPSDLRLKVALFLLRQFYRDGQIRVKEDCPEAC